MSVISSGKGVTRDTHGIRNLYGREPEVNDRSWVELFRGRKQGDVARRRKIKKRPNGLSLERKQGDCKTNRVYEAVEV